MSSMPVEAQLTELQQLRTQLRWWRLGISLGALAIVLFCVTTIIGSARRLAQPGPTQQEFVKELGAGLQQSVVPEVQRIAAQTLTESRPELEKAFGKLNERLPEVASLSMEQLDELQTNLPKRGSEVLGKTYGEMLAKLEPKIHTMFPDITEANIDTLVKNLSNEGQDRFLHAHNTLFTHHVTALDKIMGNLAKIQGSETVDPSEDKANWEMAVLLVDIFHDDFKAMQAQIETDQKTADQAAATAGGKAPKANKASKSTKATAKKGGVHGY